MDGAAFFDTDRHPLGSAGTYSNLLAPPARWGDIKAAILEAAERFATLWPERPMRREYGNRDWSRVFLAPIAPPEPPPIAVADVAHRLTGFRYDIEAWAPRLYSWPPRVYLDADPEPSRPRRYKASALRTWLRRERRREWAEGAARIVTTEDWNRYNRAHRRIEEGLVPLGPLDTYNGVKVSALCIECRNKIAWVEHNFEASAALCAPCSDLIAKAVVG
jgi:hypothetical protein